MRQPNLFSLSRKEGWRRFVDEAPRQRPETLTLRQMPTQGPRRRRPRHEGSGGGPVPDDRSARGETGREAGLRPRPPAAGPGRADQGQRPGDPRDGTGGGHLLDGFGRMGVVQDDRGQLRFRAAARAVRALGEWGSRPGRGRRGRGHRRRMCSMRQPSMGTFRRRRVLRSKRCCSAVVSNSRSIPASSRNASPLTSPDTGDSTATGVPPGPIIAVPPPHRHSVVLIPTVTVMWCSRARYATARGTPGRRITSAQ